jgi:hypothetical protein
MAGFCCTIKHMGLILVLAAISAAGSSQTEASNRGNATSVKIEMNFGKPATLQLMKAAISQISSRVFQIVVGDEHEACQLAKLINPDRSSCFRENGHEQEHEESGTFGSHKDTAKQHKSQEHNRPLPKTQTSISAKEPPNVLHQAGRDQNEGAGEREESGTFVSYKDTAKQRKTQENAARPKMNAITQDFEAHLTPGEYPMELSWRVDAVGGAAGTEYAYRETAHGWRLDHASIQAISLLPGEHRLYMLDSFGDGWNGASWTLKEVCACCCNGQPVSEWSYDDWGQPVNNCCQALVGAEHENDGAVVAGPYSIHLPRASATQVFTFTTAPTAVPTASPTVAPTSAVPTASPTVAPTSAPTFMPTAKPTFSSASNWNQLSNKCGTSACSIANGGCTIALSDDFAMGSYSGRGEIEFSGKAITIWGQGKVLDASGGGRFFIGEGAGSFLELHDAVLQNGNAAGVSGWSASHHAVLSIFPDFSLLFPLVTHATLFLVRRGHLHCGWNCCHP